MFSVLNNIGTVIFQPIAICVTTSTATNITSANQARELAVRDMFFFLEFFCINLFSLLTSNISVHFSPILSFDCFLQPACKLLTCKQILLFSVDLCYDVRCDKGYYCDTYTGYCGKNKASLRNPKPFPTVIVHVHALVWWKALKADTYQQSACVCRCMCFCTI